MSRLIMFLLLLGAIVFWWHWGNTPDAAARKRLLQRTVLGVLIAAILLLVVTGHMHWLGAILAAMLAFIRQSLPFLIKYLPIFAQWYRTQGPARPQQGSAPVAPVAGSMNVDEALQILGLSGTPTRDEITRAYRKAIQQIHPDRGGNEYFAAKVNEARDVLNSRFG